MYNKVCIRNVDGKQISVLLCLDLSYLQIILQTCEQYKNFKII